MQELIIRELVVADAENIIRFCDQEIGKGYYTKEYMLKVIQASKKEGIVVSFILEEPKTKEILGARLTYPPGQWLDGPLTRPLNSELWGVPLDKVAYFQSLFISKKVQKQGWGSKLSNKSIENLRKLGTKAIVCHSWKESEGNSSQAYLLKMGFKHIADVPKYWSEVDYHCVRCGKPCQCTANEMLYLL